MEKESNRQHVERLLKQQEWLAEEMERRSKDES